MAKPKASTDKTPEKSPALKSAPKIIDVTSDDSVGADSSARPIIVSNRPIMRDPMMAPATDQNSTLLPGEGASPAAASVGPSGPPPLDEPRQAPSALKKQIIPPSERQVSKLAPTSAPKSEPSKPAPKIDVVGVVVQDSIPESAKESEVDKSDDKATKQSESNDNNDANADDDENATNKTSDQADDLANSKAAAEASLIEKLVAARTYVLPINMVQRRRSQQAAVLGLVLIIFLAFAWLDLATDVGLIKVPYLPVTHFFSHK